MSGKRGFLGAGRKTTPAPASAPIGAKERFGLDEDAIIAAAVAGGRIVTVSKKLVFPDPDQPRKTFNKQKHLELRDSIKQNGILQPLIARSNPGAPGQYLIIAGERRWRAVMDIPELDEIHIVVRDDIEAGKILLSQLIENIQREDMTPLDTAHAFQRVMDQESLSQRELADRLGMSESLVSTYMSLFKAPASIQQVAGADGIKDVTLLAKLARLAKSAPEQAQELILGITSGELTATQARQQVGGALKDVKAKPDAENGASGVKKPKKPIAPAPKTVTRIEIKSYGWMSGSDEAVLQVETTEGSFELTFSADIEDVLAELQSSADNRAG